MRKNQYILVLLMVLIGLCSVVCATADSVTDCVHDWVAFDKSVHGIQEDEVWLKEATASHHLYMHRLPTAVCQLCGAREYPDAASGTNVQHAYRVSQWEYAEDGASVRFVMECAVCEFLNEVSIETERIRQGIEESCLLGGACDERKQGTTYSNGMILPVGDEIYPAGFDAGEKEMLYALIYDETGKTFQFAYRLCCPVCGRPRICTDAMPSAEFHEKWNGMQIMTRDYFLTIGMPDNLPYQVIDRIRGE